MRILHVSPYYADAWSYGGVPRVVTALAEALARRGHHVAVCTTDACARDARAPNRARARNGVAVHVFRNRSNRLAYDWQCFTPVGLGPFLRAELKGYDVVHIHAHRHLPELIAARACAAAGVPYVLTPNGTAPRIERRIALKALFDAVAGRRILAAAAAVTAVSAAEERQLHALGVPLARLRRLPNPVELPPPGLRPGPRPASAPRRLVLFLGKATPRKGLETLVRALPLLDPEVTLAIAGSDMGAWTPAGRAAALLGVESRIATLGLLRGDERFAALASADLVAYPSRDEVFGLVALEALLCGTPVIVGNDSGCAEIVREVGGGLDVAPGDHAALAAAIRAVLADLARWRDRARRAGLLVRRLFNADTVAERAERIYASLDGGRREACA